MGSEFISFRSDSVLRKNAELLANLERRSKSDEYREIFAAGIAEKRKQVALEKYAKEEASFGRATEISGLDAWGFAELLRERNVALNLSAKDVLAQADAL